MDTYLKQNLEECEIILSVGFFYHSKFNEIQITWFSNEVFTLYRWICDYKSSIIIKKLNSIHTIQKLILNKWQSLTDKKYLSNYKRWKYKAQKTTLIAETLLKALKLKR